MTENAAFVLTRLARTERRRIVATLARRLGDLDFAEEAVDRAFEAALEQWPREGLPASPEGWLFRAASRRATDLVRHRVMTRRSLAGLPAPVELTAAPDDEEASQNLFPDDQLRLLFTCCHPALADDARVALALRLLSGLSTEEVARAFFVPEVTMAQRLVRAKKKIRDAGIPYAVPEKSELPERLTSVLSVVYLIFNEGYLGTRGKSLQRIDLATEAIRLGELLVALLPSEAEPRALLALMLLVDARSTARSVGDDESLVLLEDQNRGSWDRSKIARGKALLTEALSLGRPSAFAIEAAIQAVHDDAAEYASTDFAQIVTLYGILRSKNDSPIIELNEAAAIAMAEGPGVGLVRLEAIERRGDLSDLYLFWAAKGDLLRRLGRGDEARCAYERALVLVTNESERRYLQRRHDELPDAMAAGRGRSSKS